MSAIRTTSKRSARVFRGAHKSVWPVVEIGDIRDAYGFVRGMIAKSGIKAWGDAYEELICEGVLILCELHERYDPEKDTGDKAAFAGYAAYLLPRKLTNSWHKLHPNHVLRTQEDGKRRYVYYQDSKSLDEMRENAQIYKESGTENNLGLWDEEHGRRVGDFINVPERPA